jgi:hypothetical protein
LKHTPRTERHDEEPDLRWYVTPGVPVPLFNHAYFTRLAQEEDIDARIEGVVGSFAEREVPFMWSVGPFTQPTDLDARLESRGLSRADKLPGMAVDVRAINENVPSPSALERVMNLGENRIGRRIPRSAWFLRDLRFPHS